VSSPTESDDKYILFGSYASYFTAKTRTFLRKKGIPFVEHLPSDPVFREKVRPVSGSHRIPQLLTPEGEVIQDTVEILDRLESSHPEVPAFPETPKQKIFVHLMELLGSEGLLRLAWMHRWVFSENMPFVKMDFGRSFKPQGSDEELLKYGNLIADRMKSGGGLPEITTELMALLDKQYLGLLEKFEQHLISHPYFLGGHPSAADYAVMGALHAHLGRDPAGLRLMQDNAPRVFRWVEHMIVPEIQSPEFFDRVVEYPADDEVPKTAISILEYIAENFAERFVLDSLAFNQFIERQAPESGFVFNEEMDQPMLPVETVEFSGREHEVIASLHSIWIAQRAQRYFQSLESADQNQIKEMLGDGLSLALVSTPVAAAIKRVNNRLMVS